MIHLATGNDVKAARKALGVSQGVLGTYWGSDAQRGREVVGDWERCGDALVPKPRVAAILLNSLRRGWFPEGGQGIKKKRRVPVAAVSGQAIRDVRTLFDLRVDDLAAYWGMSRANVGHLELREVLPNSPMWDILLDDILRQERRSILRWGARKPPMAAKPAGD